MTLPETTQLVTKIFLILLCLKAVTEAWLNQKNRRYIANNKSEVPEKFKEQITLEEHQKAANYSIEKIKVGKHFQTYDLIILLIWTFGGGIEALNTFSKSFNLSSIKTGLLFFGAFSLINMLIGLPESLYSTFVVEEKFGFNKTTKKIFIMDMVKGLAIGITIGLPILAALLWIMEALGNNWWVYGWAFLTATQFFIIWLYPTFIAPIFNKFSPLEEGAIKEKVVALLDRTGFKSNGLFVMDASKRSGHGNAYFTGFGKNKRIVFFDNLISTLEPDEVEAVLAHELGHFKRKHILK